MPTTRFDSSNLVMVRCPACQHEHPVAVTHRTEVAELDLDPEPWTTRIEADPSGDNHGETRR